MRQLPAVYVHPAHLGAAVKRWHRLAGIEQPLGIEGALDRVKALQLQRCELHAHLIDLFDADAVLAGDRPASLDA